MQAAEHDAEHAAICAVLCVHWLAVAESARIVLFGRALLEPGPGL